MISVKSALSIYNGLSIPVEIVGVLNERHYNLTTMQVEQWYIVPLSMVKCDLHCRPLKRKSNYALSNEYLDWKDVRSHEERGILLSCFTNSKPYNAMR